MITIMSDYIRQLFTDGRRLTFSASEPVFHIGDPVRRMHLVVEGEVALTRQTRAGASVRLQQAGPGQVLAEASAYAQAYHCDAASVAGAVIRSLPLAVFRARLAEDVRAAEAWAAHLARAVQAARMRAELRTLRTVSERLDAWLGEAGALPEKGGWTHLADELGVTREALYRELARRRATSV